MEAIGGFVIVIWLFLIVLAILWICMPFALFGTKPILRQILAEQKKMNALLQAQADRAKEIRDRAEALRS